MLKSGAMIIGAIVSGILLIMVIADSFALALKESSSVDTEGFLFGYLPALLVCTAFIISWRWNGIGGWLLIASYLLLALAPSLRVSYVLHRFEFFPDMWIYASPLPLAGILLLISSSISKRQTKRVKWT